MARDRWYVVYDEREGKNIVVGWNLPHEPNEENECGYPVVSGPYDTESEAKDAT